jgi:hypothetical protein
MSSYKSHNLFGSGPHRFAISRLGHLVTQDFFFGGAGGGGTAQGLVDPEVLVTGRLAASTESALRALRDAVVAQLLDPPTPGTLVDNHGRTFADMAFVGYEEADRVDKGRVWSVEYAATFRRL